MKQQTLETTTWKIMSNILTMKIFHAVPVFLKESLLFLKRACESVLEKDRKLTLRRSARKIIYQVKMSDTKSVIKPTKRPRMSLDMFGEWILILLESKSGNIERLLLRFWLRK